MIKPPLLFLCLLLSSCAHLQSGSEVIRDANDLSGITCAKDSAARKQVRVSDLLIEAPWNQESIEALEKVSMIRKRLINGEDFLALSKEYSAYAKGQPIDGDLGFFERGTMVPPFEQVAFCMPLNKYSPIVKTSFGYHVLNVKEVKY